MPESLLTIPEVATILHVKPCTVRNAWLDGRIPGIKIGKLVRFSSPQIQRIASEGLPPPPHVEIAAEAR
jgi:excisionase family DNA binding protein